MRMKKINSTVLLSLLGGALMIMTSCERPPEEPSVTLDNLKGMFVVCEGLFGQATGDITWYNTQSGEVVKNLFYTANGKEPGDVVQDFVIVDTLGFIVVNNSQQMAVVNMNDFSLVKNITGFSYPRSVVQADDQTLYLSNGNGSTDNYIYKISLSELKKTDSLAVDTGPEKLLKIGSKVYVALSGGWNNDGNSVLAVDPSSFTFSASYTVGSVPVDLAADKNGDLWVYCSGLPDYSGWPDVTYSGAGISRITLTDGTVNTLEFSVMSASGQNNIAVSKNGTTVYYLNEALYSMPVATDLNQGTILIDKPFYGVDLDPLTGDLVCLDAVESRAEVYSVTGEKLYDFETLQFPRSVTFSY